AAGLDAKLDEVVRGFGTPSRKEHTPMQALRIANYKVTKGTFPELADEAKGMLSSFKAQPGFIRYGLADTGQGTCLTISLWETHAEAEAAAPVAATWVSEHLADRVELRSNKVGDLAFFEGMPTSV
ncbi:MAG: antibiotic biosynthesis monooxygenase, partial [Actinomycetota bacterium]|nr:antibiotic biosynthesis monooxygenase [Actinomycetota bacterium]